MRYNIDGRGSGMVVGPFSLSGDALEGVCFRLSLEVLLLLVDTLIKIYL